VGMTRISSHLSPKILSFPHLLTLSNTKEQFMVMVMGASNGRKAPIYRRDKLNSLRPRAA
jgi:hypothetical protein